MLNIFFNQERKVLGLIASTEIGIKEWFAPQISEH
jgi:hypothetical protein